MYKVDVREVLVEAQPQTIITNDNLNAKVDAQVYLKVRADEENVKASQYNVTNYELQIVNLARTTLRNIIGTMTLKSANSERGKINEELRKTLLVETASWGIEILRTELKEIDPPADVQETMNKVVKAENEKVAAVDFATATETKADGERRAEVKRAEGIRQAKILEAQGEAEAIKLVNEAAERYFVGNAQVLRKLEAVKDRHRPVGDDDVGHIVRVHFESGGAVFGFVHLARAEGMQQRAQDAAHVRIVVADEEAQLIEIYAEHGPALARRRYVGVNHMGRWLTKRLRCGRLCRLGGKSFLQTSLQ